MNKELKVLLAVLGGIEVTFHIFTPILIAVLWINLGEVSGFYSTFFYIIGFASTIFRAIKVGFLKE